MIKTITFDLVPKLRRKTTPVVPIAEGAENVPRTKSRAKRGTGAPRRRAPRKFTSTTVPAIPDLNLDPVDAADVPACP